MKKIIADLIVVGGGSGGFASALKAARMNKKLRVVIIEKNHCLGGSSTIGGVNCWEPGIGGESGLHSEIAIKLLKKQAVAAVGKTVHYYKKDEPWGLSVPSKEYEYKWTLRRAGLAKNELYRFHYEPYEMANEMESMLLEENVEIHLNTNLISLKKTANSITSIICNTNNEEIEFIGKYYVDSSGDILLARLAGCKVDIGTDNNEKYNEALVNKTKSNSLNGASLVFRVSPCKKEIEDLPDWVTNEDNIKWLLESKTCGCAINEYPNKDLNMNILPVLKGEEYWFSSDDIRKRKALARVLIYWNFYQKEKGFDNYKIKYIFPMIGVRESYRLIGKYILTLNDINETYIKQKNKKSIIGFSDHPADTHGVENSMIKELKIPYGIPYETMITNEVTNLIVACRGISLSHLAASSCRLTRVMLSIGEAAGVASALAFNEDCTYEEIDIIRLRSILKIDETLKYIKKTYS